MLRPVLMLPRQALRRVSDDALPARACCYAQAVDAAQPTEPWKHPQLGESLRSFRIFVRFLEMGRDRSFDALAKELGVGRQFLYNLSSQFRWATRIAGYEAHLDRQRLEKIERIHKETAAYEAIAELHMSRLLARNAKRLNEKHEQDPGFILPAGAHAQVSDLIARRSRTGRGDASERVEVRGDPAAELLSTLKEIGQRRSQVKDVAVQPHEEQI